MVEESEIRKAVDEVRRNNTWATRLQVALVAVMVAAVLASVGFMALAVQRSNEQRRVLTDLAEIIQTYNEEHAKQAADSFQTLNDSQRCAILKLFTGDPFEKIRPEEIAACYQPVSPAPQPPTTTTTRR